MNEKLPPIVPLPPEKPQGRVRMIVLILVGCAFLEVPAYLLWNRTRRAERELWTLSEQAQELRREVSLAQAQSGAAISRASQAQESAAPGPVQA